MVDNGTIRLYAPELVGKDIGIPYHYTPDFETGNPIPVIKLHNDFDNSFLSITIKNTGAIKIRGSLRKWFFGARSLIDFTHKTFYLAIIKLAHRLEIPPDKLLNARISSFEFGKNIFINSSPGLIFPCLVKHNRLKKDTFGNNNEGVKFRGENYSLSLYDKVKEMKKRGNINSILASKINIIRYELKINKTSALPSKIGDIQTIYDIRKNWNRLITVWHNEFERVEILNNLMPSREQIGHNLFFNTLSDSILIHISNAGVANISNFNKLIVSPNPSNGKFVFSNIEKENTIEIIDISGRLISKTISKDISSSIDITGTANGMYFYYVTDHNKIVHQGKLIIQ